MPLRHRIRKGDYLAVDDQTGVTHYASEMARDYNGNFVLRATMDPIHPQLFVRALYDPQPVTVFNPAPPEVPASDFQPYYVGDPTVVVPPAPASFLFPYDLSIPQMAVGSTFVVR